MIMDEMKGHAALWDLSSPFKNTIWDLCMRELSGIVEVLVRCKPLEVASGGHSALVSGCT